MTTTEYRKEIMNYKLELQTAKGKIIGVWFVDKKSVFDKKYRDFKELIFEAIQKYQDEFGGKK
jgi:hypothetical protein